MTHSPSPVMNWLRPVMVSIERGKMVLKHTIRPEMANPMGILHGGMTALIIDDAIGATIFAYDEPYYYVTINNAIDYFSSAKVGDVVLTETSTVKKGKQIVNMQCEIWNETRTRLIARGYSNLMRTEKEIEHK